MHELFLLLHELEADVSAFPATYRILMVECVPISACCPLVLSSLPHAHQWLRNSCNLLVVPCSDGGQIFPKICDLTFWRDACSCSDNDGCGFIPGPINTVSAHGA